MPFRTTTRRSATNRVVLGSLTAVMLLAGCSSDGSYGGDGNTATSPSTSADGSAAGGGSGPTISNFAFSIPDGLTAGAPFTVTNDDGTTHTFTDPDGAFDVTVPAGGTAEVTVAAAGTYQVVCKIHGSMKATLTIG